MIPSFQAQLQDRSKSQRKNLDYLHSILQHSNTSLKCNELKQSISYFHLKDLHHFLPHLLSNIFGFDQTYGWGLQFLTSSHPEFIQVHKFLSPEGELFNLLTKLDKQECTYEFPLIHLPHPIPNGESDHHVSYGGKTHIQLSALDYFFYHFSYFVLHFKTNQGIINLNMQESLYTHLLDAYLNYYLPLCGVVPISPKFLQLKEVLGCQQSAIIPKPALLYIKSGSQRDVYVKTSSEKFVETLMEFWLNYSVQHKNVLSFSQETFLPSDECLILFRRLIKHIHYFANGQTVATSQSSELVQITDALRRSIISTLFRKRLYHYLQSCLKCSPLDGSYRYIVELWLTYIQPWRYTDPGQTSDHLECISAKWKYFILDNFPFYSTLLMEILERCHSLDLTTFNHLIILYRVCKVFAKNDLSKFIKFGESLLLNTCVHDTGQDTMKESLIAAPHTIKASFIECCGPEFIYNPLFHESTVLKIQKLLLKVSWSRDIVTLVEDSSKKQLHLNPDSYTTHSPVNNKERSFFEKMTGYFTVEGHSYKDDSDDTMKVIPMLDSILTNLLKIYELPDPALLFSQETTLPTEDDIRDISSIILSPTIEDINISSASKLKIECHGDPLMQPLRSYENQTLANMLFHSSTYLNKWFAPQLGAIGASNNIVCKYLTSLLSYPQTNEQGNDPPTPRINLRPFASYYNLIFLIILAALFYIFV